MSRTKYAAELCALVVEDIYGELSSRIVTLLLRRGRLSIPSLQQHTKLTPKHLRHGLAVLIQQNLVYHYFDKDIRLTFYEANQDALYFLLRFGKIADAVQSRYGDVARDIVQELLVFGSMKIGDLADKFDHKQYNGTTKINARGHESDLANGNVNGRNGLTHVPLQNRFDDVLHQLSQGGFIELVIEGMFLSPSDTYNKVENEVLREHFNGATKGTKQKEELRKMIRERLGDLRSQREKGLSKTVAGDGLVNGDAKRRKLENGASLLNGSSHSHRNESLRLDRNLIIRVNYEKCNVALRNERLISLAFHDIGPTTSQVYAELLRLMEPKVPRCQLNANIDEPEDAAEDTAISTIRLTAALSNAINVAVGIGRAASDQLDTRQLETSQRKRKRSMDNSEVEVESDASSDEMEQAGDEGNDDNITEVDHDSDSHGDDDFVSAPTEKPSSRQLKVTFQTTAVSREDRNNRIGQINKHLLLLAEHSKSLVLRCGGGGGGEWTVDFATVIQYLKETQLDTYVLQSFGEKGRRISRILRQKGKLDEKQIQKFGLLKQKDVRTKLIEMQMAGFVDIQEVPRDNNRTPSRTIFLWYFDTERVTAILLERIYKTMSRHLQVLKYQKIGYKDELAAAARSDIRGREAEYLKPEVFSKLQTIREIEATCLVQISRLDDLVAIFRDF